MSEKKPTPIIKRRGKPCPFCGQQSYSPEGIHPQCAMNQADAPRKLRLATEKKMRATERLRTLAKPG